MCEAQKGRRLIPPLGVGGTLSIFYFLKRAFMLLGTSVLLWRRICRAYGVLLSRTISTLCTIVLRALLNSLLFLCVVLLFFGRRGVRCNCHIWGLEMLWLLQWWRWRLLVSQRITGAEWMNVWKNNIVCIYCIWGYVIVKPISFLLHALFSLVLFVLLTNMFRVTVRFSIAAFQHIFFSEKARQQLPSKFQVVFHTLMRFNQSYLVTRPWSNDVPLAGLLEIKSVTARFIFFQTPVSFFCRADGPYFNTEQPFLRLFMRLFIEMDIWVDILSFH